MSSITQKPPAKESFPEVFNTLHLIRDRLIQWIHKADPPEEEPYFGIAKVSILFRALNQYRSIINLLGENHWDDALVLTRSLFELLLNAEELTRQEKINPEKASEKFFLFYELQNYLVLREIWSYHVHIGLKPPEIEGEIKRLDKLARKVFRQFWLPPSRKRRSGMWKQSWQGKSKKQLCKDSDDPDRKYQYKIFYALGSQFAHSGSEAVLPSIFLTSEQPPDLRKFIAHMDATEEKMLGIVAKYASGFFMELVDLFADCLPEYDSSWVDNAFALIKQI